MFYFIRIKNGTIRVGHSLECYKDKGRTDEKKRRKIKNDEKRKKEKENRKIKKKKEIVVKYWEILNNLNNTCYK